MTNAARIVLEMDVEERDAIARAAALAEMTIADFMRFAAREKARALLECGLRITLPREDFAGFTEALDSAFRPNPALENALGQVRRRVRRAAGAAAFAADDREPGDR